MNGRIVVSLLLCATALPAVAIDTIRFAAREITAAGTRFENVEVKLVLDPKTGLPRGRVSAGSTLIGPVAFDVALSERPELRETTLTGDRFAIAGGELGIEAVFTPSRWRIEGRAERIESDGLLTFTRRYINIPPDITAAGRLDGLVRFVGRPGRELPTEAYADFVGKAIARMLDTSAPITHAEDVAEAVWRAATDPSSPMRIPAGADAEAWAAEAG